MRTDSISATTLARKLATILDQVRYTGKPVHITKGNRVVADICPPKPMGLPIEELANVIAHAPSLGSDGKQFAKDLKKIRRSSKNELEDSWD